MADWISPLQRGFLHGRSMLHNVMDVEQAAMEVSLQDADAAMLLFDFAAAFPSLGPELIEETLAHLGLPAEVLATVAALYDGNHCSLIAGGCRHRGFPMLRGLRQGCPLSPLLYVLVADSLLRALAAAVPTATVRGYADDTAMVLQQWRTHWPAIQQIFTRFAAVSGLDLNIGKTVLIPLGDESCEAVRASLAAAGDLWMDIEVARWGRYLGFAVGPGRSRIRGAGRARNSAIGSGTGHGRNLAFIWRCVFSTYSSSRLSLSSRSSTRRQRISFGWWRQPARRLRQGRTDGYSRKTCASYVHCLASQLS